MYTLFLDTHDAEIVIALYKDNKIVDKVNKVSSRNHSDFTIPMLNELLNANHISVHDLGQIFVVNGPGSFTGVRLGVTIAKTLAYTLNIPIKTVTSLEMYAISNKEKNNKLVVIHDLKGVFGGLFKENNELIGEYFYKSNEEYQEYIKESVGKFIVVEPCEIDFNYLYEFMNTKESILAHQVNPLYIKVIEALKHD